jgi:hypothetical protein
LSGLKNLEQRVKKFVELRGEDAENIPSLVAVIYILPGRDKNLSAPLRMHKPLFNFNRRKDENFRKEFSPKQIRFQHKMSCYLRPQANWSIMDW